MLYFVVNPAAKTGKGLQRWHLVKAYLISHNISYKAYCTTRKVSASMLIRRILDSTEDKIRIFVLGGDGTINEALQSIRKEDTDRLCLGYLPTGSSNDLARSLQYSKDIYSNLDTLINSDNIHPVDIGLVKYNNTSVPGYTKRYFIVSAGIGFDACVCHEVAHSKLKKWLNMIKLGKFTYVAICIKQLLTLSTAYCRLTIDEDRHITLKNCYYLALMNHCYQGGGIKFSPSAVNDDGLLNISYAADISKAGILTTLPLAFSGRHIGKKGIGDDKCTHIHIEFDSPLWVHTDGEVVTKSSNLDIYCLNRHINFILPEE